MAKESSYRRVLFDWDGCIFDSLPLWLRVCRGHLNERGITLSDKEIARIVVPNLTKVTEYGVKAEHVLAYRMSVLKTGSELLHEVNFHEGVLELVKQLAAMDIPYSIVTSSLLYFVETSLDNHQVRDLFPHIVSREDVQYTKPHPEPLEKALQLIDRERKHDREPIAKNEVLMIGDSWVDIRAAKGIADSVLFYPRSHWDFYDWKTLKDEGPTHVVESFAELQELIVNVAMIADLIE
jgi:pyrophosphatase PpaX